MVDRLLTSTGLTRSHCLTSHSNALRFSSSWVLATLHPGTFPLGLIPCNTYFAPPFYTSQQKPVDLAICIGLSGFRQSDLKNKSPLQADFTPDDIRFHSIMYYL